MNAHRTRRTSQRERAKDRKSGRYVQMKACDACGKRGELWPEYEADGTTMTGRDVCLRCAEERKP